MTRTVFVVILVAGLVSVLTIVLSVAPALVVKTRQRARLRRACRGKLALTYDDGPEPRLTPALLELLERRGVRATFFLVGFRALRHPELCDRVAAAGHEVGCHTFWHRHAWKRPPWRSVLDLEQGYRRMRRWLPGRALFRPPFGKLTTWSWLAARRRAAALAWWTCDAGDQTPRRPAAEDVAARVVRDGGGVVLMHFHDSGAEREAYVLDVTCRLLDAAEEHGLEVCTYSQVLERAA